MNKIAIALGLPEDASEAEIIKAASKLSGQNDKLSKKVDDLLEQLDELKLSAKRIPKGIDEDLVRRKMEAGLSKEQAVDAVLRQIEEDERQAKADKKSK